MIKDFKDFIMRGNVIDLAVGIVIGVAFGKIVSSFVGDILMPPIGVLLGQVDFSTLSYILVEKTADKAAVVIAYGKFINTLIDFIIISFAIFIIVKQVAKLQKPVAADPTKECSQCCTKVPAKAKRCPACTSELKI